ncbi:TldD/PmbA family protein [Siccirubricoccus sp. KC 17139]|uniref:TldD/PmbA family protein n=1 Tax=Siccirubricoccus soli TaxID=2899147 RepID=A0ABT1D3A9_9PROT|nr:TldD/PmbA family protein [Siccirubricoccus soli]MCO6415765.1 TldD/PmbA family protein [Siccirubricoccus soli]MCP2681897.1 TldD/PmbA family protein [Siccirubricoccus soli]
MSHLDTLEALVAAARRAGADAADALLVSSASLSVSRRLGKIEQLERAEGFDLGLRVFLGQRQAIVSSTDPSPAGFAALAERAVAMAKVVPEDPFAGLAETPDGLTQHALDLSDPAEPSAEELIARTAAAEDAAMAIPGVTNSEGADAHYGRTRIALVTSRGFAGEYERTGHSLSATALAGQGTGMERDYDYTSAVHLADLEDAATIGRRAGEKAVARLNPIRPKTAKLPVVYDPRVASSLLGHLAGAINGAAVARGTSFLRDRLGQRVMAAGLTVIDDPTRRRGLRSRPFDGEGMQGIRRALVEDGVLTTWVLDWRSARQLGLASTGHASRGTGGPPSPSTTNLYLAAGSLTPAALMADIREGLYVTELIGSGVNGVTGDYSRGAAGFMIRDGALAEPVSEITIAGNLKDMLLNLTPADDLEFRRGTDSPTVRVEGLTLAGA